MKGQWRCRVLPHQSEIALPYLQAATEQAARALALYAKEAQELSEQLAQAQSKSRGSGAFATLLQSARRSFLRTDSSAAGSDQVRSSAAPVLLKSSCRDSHADDALLALVIVFHLREQGLVTGDTLSVCVIHFNGQMIHAPCNPRVEGSSIYTKSVVVRESLPAPSL